MLHPDAITLRIYRTTSDLREGYLSVGVEEVGRVAGCDGPRAVEQAVRDTDVPASLLRSASITSIEDKAAAETQWAPFGSRKLRLEKSPQFYTRDDFHPSIGDRQQCRARLRGLAS